MVGRMATRMTTRIMEVMEMKREDSRLPHSNMYSTYMTMTLPALKAAPIMTMSMKASTRKLRRSLAVPGPEGKRISSGARGFDVLTEWMRWPICRLSGDVDVVRPAHSGGGPRASCSRACFSRASKRCFLDSDSGMMKTMEKTKKAWHPRRM